MPLRALQLLAALVILGVLSGCGECIGATKVRGLVRNATGQPIAGARLSTCSGDRCVAGPTDAPCATATSDAQGVFVLEVVRCRPKAFACELRPVRGEREGCEPASVQPGLDGELVITLRCH